MDREQEIIHKQMEETRSGLTDKLSALEAQVNTTVQATTDAVQSTTDAVTGTVESVKETVENVSDKLHETVAGVTESVQQAVEDVKESVGETVKSVAETFNLKLQAERHPWMVFGGAVTVGCVGALLLGGSGHKPAPASSSGRRLSPGHEGGGKTKTPNGRAPSQQSSDAGEGWLWDKLGSFKNLAVGAMMGVVRDLVARAVPENLKERVSEEMDKLTKSVGGEPIQGALLPENQANPSEQEPAQAAGGQSQAETTAGRGGRPFLVKNGR